MLVDFEAMTSGEVFEVLTAAVVPRPIALVTTLARDRVANAAPYSFFNIMGIGPPVVALTVLPGAEARMKDTGRNILQTREFVVNFVSERRAQWRSNGMFMTRA